MLKLNWKHYKYVLKHIIKMVQSQEDTEFWSRRYYSDSDSGVKVSLIVMIRC